MSYLTQQKLKFLLNILFLILKMGIVRLNWKIKLNYLPAHIKAVYPELVWRSILAPFSNQRQEDHWIVPGCHDLMLSGVSNLGLAVTQAFGRVGGHHKHQTQTGDSVTHIDQHGLGKGGPGSSIPNSLNLLQPRCSSAMSTAFPNGTWVSWPGHWPPPCTDKARN